MNISGKEIAGGIDSAGNLYFYTLDQTGQLVRVEISPHSNAVVENGISIGMTVRLGDRLSAYERGWFEKGVLPRPSANAEFILSLFVDRSNLDAAIGDFAEDYQRYYRRYGKLRAWIWCWTQVVISAWPILRRLFKWSAVIAIIQVLLSFIGS